MTPEESRDDSRSDFPTRGETPTTAHKRLLMLTYLRAVEVEWQTASETLIAEGYHPNVVWRKAEKANDRGYVECGVSERLSWLTDEGRVFLAAHAEDPV